MDQLESAIRAICPNAGDQLLTLINLDQGSFSNSPFTSSPSTKIDTIKSILAGPIMPCSIDLSNGFGSDPPQGVRAFLGSWLTFVNPR